MQQVDEVLKRHEGECPVVIEVPVLSGLTCRLISRTRRSEWSPALELELQAVYGVVLANGASGTGQARFVTRHRSSGMPREESHAMIWGGDQQLRICSGFNHARLTHGHPVTP